MANTEKQTFPAKCRHCQSEMRSPAFCAGCDTLYPVEGVDYFSLLGLEADYDVDPKLLQERYLNLTRAVHPDRLRSDAAEVQQLSLRTTANINRAKVVLSDPILRAAYMLERAGGKSAADDKTVPQEVLGEALMLREELDEARAEDDEATIADIRARVAARHDVLLEQIAASARQLPGDEALRDRLRAQLNAIRYYEKLQEQLQGS